MNVLVGAMSCLLKFSQDEGLRRLLVSSQSAVLIEAAPHDGCWGVGKNSHDFLCQDEPMHYALQSQEPSTLSFRTRGGDWVKRPRCEANALGKALMVVREVLRKSEGARLEPTTLREILFTVGKKLKALDVPFDWKDAGKHLTHAFAK